MRLMYLDHKYVNIKRIKYLTELYYIKIVKYFHINKHEYFTEISKILEDHKFANFLLTKVFDILGLIKYQTTIGHSLNCLLVAIFNIICKYSIDYYFSVNDTDCPEYSKLEFDILSDISWTIS